MTATVASLNQIVMRDQLNTGNACVTLDPMQNPPSAFSKPQYADYELTDIVDEWLLALESRPVSADTLKNYRKTLVSFQKSLALHQKPATLASLSESNVLEWKRDLRKGVLQNNPSGQGQWVRPASPASEATVRTYIIIIKVFANRWIKRRYADTDLLDLVELGKENVEPKEGMTLEEREKLLQACDGNSFEAVRDRAFVQLLLATACRFKEIHGLTTEAVDIDAKRMWVVLKGGRQVPVDIDGRALRDLRVYLGRRRLVADAGTREVWLTDSGAPLTYWGAYGIFSRLSERSGVKCNPHRFRHTVAQTAAASGAPIADVQDLLHHTSDKMSRRYIGNARQDVAAGLAKKWSLAG